MKFSNQEPRACNKKCEKDLEDSIKKNSVYEGAGSPFSLLKEKFDEAGIEAVCKFAAQIFIDFEADTKLFFAESLKNTRAASQNASWPQSWPRRHPCQIPGIEQVKVAFQHNVGFKLLRQRLSANAQVTTADAGGAPSAGSRRPPHRAGTSRADKSGATKRSASPSRTAAASDDLEDLSKEALYERAQKLDIPGRSKMGRQALINAIRKAA